MKGWGAIHSGVSGEEFLDYPHSLREFDREGGLARFECRSAADKRKDFIGEAPGAISGSESYQFVAKKRIC